MTLAALLPLVLKASIAGTVLAVGLRTRRQDVLSLFRDPDKLARSFLSMLVTASSPVASRRTATIRVMETGKRLSAWISASSFISFRSLRSPAMNARW